MLKVVMHEDKQSLEISCDCEEDSGSPSETNKIVFSLNPQLSLSPANNDAETAEDKSESLPEEDVPVAFVVRVWTHKGYLIVQVNENDFAVYGLDGCFVEAATGLNDARELINKRLSPILRTRMK